MYRNQRQFTPSPKRDESIARFNALFKSADEVERDTHTQRLAEARVKAEADRAIARAHAIETIRSAITAHRFGKGDLFV
jgi:hypothetical protein